MRKRLLRFLVPVLAAGVLLAGLIVLGQWARDALRAQGRYTIRFIEIDCAPPPGEKREEFLSEVQYLGEQPQQVSVLDDDLAARLTQAFARHPWVEKVEGVEPVPPRTVRVRLTYRSPVLAVFSPPSAMAPDQRRARREAQPDHAWIPRVVDGHGVVLPPGRMSLDALPALKDDDIPPPAAAGAPWGDRRVEVAARTAAYLHPYQDRFHFSLFAVDDDGLVLSDRPAAVVRWGHAPGDETDNEAPAARKLERMLEYCRQHGGLGTAKEPCDLDVRRR
jgi:hypothetical protein